MRKIIDGKMYNTETARFLFQVDWMREGLDLVIVEDVYLKKTGKFFTHKIVYKIKDKEKDFITKNDCFDTTQGYVIESDIIIETDHDTYMQYCEINLSVDEYIEIFGDVDE